MSGDIGIIYSSNSGYLGKSEIFRLQNFDISETSRGTSDNSTHNHLCYCSVHIKTDLNAMAIEKLQEMIKAKRDIFYVASPSCKL